MSDIQRYAVIETALCIGGNVLEGEVEMVRASEHDTELAALREELAECNKRKASWIDSAKTLDERLTAAEQRNAAIAASVVERQDVQVAAMPFERCCDVRAKMIIAFNEAKKNGGDLDDALDAAYKSALRFSPNPLNTSPPAPVAVILPERMGESTRGNGWNACLEKVKEMNQ